MALFLQWGGSFPETRSMDNTFLKTINTSKKLLYIPTAMIGSFTYEECYAYLSGIIENLAPDLSIEMVDELEKLKNKDLFEYGGIYIWGGNTFRLLYLLRKYRIHERLVDYLNSNGSICWGSAGAIIFGENIHTSPDANITNLQDTTGLQQGKGHSFWCHYKEKHNQQIQEYVKYHDVPVIALPENAGLKIDKNKILSIWEGPVTLFQQNKKTSYKPWKILFWW